MIRKEIEIGHTNKKYRDDNKFILIKNRNGFNHKIDYKLLAQFAFVPRLISETETEVVWEFVEGKILTKPTSDDLQQLARIARELHQSDLHFPKNNLQKRMQKYLNIIHDRKKTTIEIENNYREIIDILSQMSQTHPCHNDLRWENIIKDKTGKLWIVDWEYATMGDKHFDLAYFMEHFDLSDEQRKVFLNEYNLVNDDRSSMSKWIAKCQRFVNYLTLCWALSQDKLPFPLDGIKRKLR